MNQLFAAKPGICSAKIKKEVFFIDLLLSALVVVTWGITIYCGITGSKEFHSLIVASVIVGIAMTGFATVNHVVGKASLKSLSSPKNTPKPIN